MAGSVVLLVALVLATAGVLQSWPAPGRMWVDVGAAAAGMVLLGLAGAWPQGSRWLIVAAAVPVAYLFLSAAPMAISLRAGPVVRLALAVAAVVVYVRVAAGQSHRMQYGACLGVLGSAAVFFQVWEPPPPKPLPIVKSLALLEPELLRAMPAWTGRHERLDEKIEKVLGADEYLNLNLTSPDQKTRVLVFVTYNANAMSQVPHVPWVCMVQAGFRQVDFRQDDMPIVAIPGKEIQPNVILFERGEGPGRLRALMFQYFNVGGSYTANRQVARVLSTWSSLRGSYLSQTQVAVWLPPGDTQDPLDRGSPAYRLGAQFVNVLVPLLEKEYYPDLRGAEGG